MFEQLNCSLRRAGAFRLELLQLLAEEKSGELSPDPRGNGGSGIT